MSDQPRKPNGQYDFDPSAGANDLPSLNVPKVAGGDSHGLSERRERMASLIDGEGEPTEDDLAGLSPTARTIVECEWREHAYSAKAAANRKWNNRHTPSKYRRTSEEEDDRHAADLRYEIDCSHAASSLDDDSFAALSVHSSEWLANGEAMPSMTRERQRMLLDVGNRSAAQAVASRSSYPDMVRSALDRAESRDGMEERADVAVLAASNPSFPVDDAMAEARNHAPSDRSAIYRQVANREDAPEDVKEGCRQYIRDNRTPREQGLMGAITWDNEARARQSYMESHGGWDQEDYNRSQGRNPNATLSESNPYSPDFKHRA
jgi:hypothetical protein